MNIYEDYVKYIGEKEQLITKLQTTSSKVLICLNDCIKVLDYIYCKYNDHAKIDADMEEIFDIGYGYLANVLNDLNTYYIDYFNKDIILFNKYATIMFYSLYMDDLKSFLASEELLTEERKKALDETMNSIDSIMVNKKDITNNFEKDIENIITSLLPTSVNFRPTYTVFELIAEELNLI